MRTDLLRAIASAIRRWHIRRTTIDQLAALDDRMLRDIGLHRGEIRPLVDGCLDRAATAPDKRPAAAPAADRGPPRPAGWVESCNA